MRMERIYIQKIIEEISDLTKDDFIVNSLIRLRIKKKKRISTIVRKMILDSDILSRGEK